MKTNFPIHLLRVAPVALHLGAVALLGTLATATALAQSSAAPGLLAPVTITGNPLGAADLIAPAVALSATNLTLRSKSTLGETLDGLTGVSSTYFGPNASRPVIRGLDGDRVRILTNS
ncbi:MAG: TonB-dependent receptor plug domain-containing protein, partial [Burkholderiaceae bacterium]